MGKNDKVEYKNNIYEVCEVDRKNKKVLIMESGRGLVTTNFSTIDTIEPVLCRWVNISEVESIK